MYSGSISSSTPASAPRLVNVVPADRTRVLILSDVTNEADDPFAIAHALLSPSLDVRGIVATHYVKTGSTEESYAEAMELVRLLGREGDVPVVRGAAGPLAALPEDAELSEGARLIIREALSDDERRLHVLVLGAITEVAEALAAEPAIEDRMTVVFVGGAGYPEGGREANLTHDIDAARAMFASQVELWQLTSNAYHEMVVPIAWLARRVAPLGELGAHLYQRVVDFDEANAEKFWVLPECWTLGDNVAVAALLFAHTMPWEELPAPAIGEGGAYLTGNGRTIRVYEHVNAHPIFDDLVSKLELFAEGVLA